MVDRVKALREWLDPFVLSASVDRQIERIIDAEEETDPAPDVDENFLPDERKADLCKRLKRMQGYGGDEAA